MRKHQYLTFFKKLFILCIALFLVDMVAGKVLEYFYLRMGATGPSRITIR